MRKVVAYELVSLDGVAEHPDEFISEWDAAMDENLGSVIATQDAVLLGRRTYDEWAAFWPGSAIEPFASFINGVKKFVATSTPPASGWSNATFIDGDLAAFVTALRLEPGGDIGVHGSIALLQSLLELGLVDELRLVVAPVLHVRGRRLFERGLARRLALARCVASPSGSLLLDYVIGD